MSAHAGVTRKHRVREREEGTLPKTSLLQSPFPLYLHHVLFQTFLSWPFIADRAKLWVSESAQVTQAHPCQLAKPCDEQAPALCVGRVSRTGDSCVPPHRPHRKGSRAQPTAGGNVTYSGFLCSDLRTLPAWLAIPSRAFSL